MKKRALLVIAFALAVMPTAAFATFSVIQDSCRVAGNSVTTSFSVVNFNSPVAVADLHFLPENPVPGCTMIGCGAPAGWNCALNAATHGVDYVALDPAAYIYAGQIRHGFDFVLDPEFCCYIVQFTGPNHEILFEQEECFSCVHVGVEPQTWGNVKKLFQ
jgi:hypothetical protein